MRGLAGAHDGDQVATAAQAVDIADDSTSAAAGPAHFGRRTPRPHGDGRRHHRRAASDPAGGRAATRLAEAGERSEHLRMVVGQVADEAFT